jgi:transposase
MALPENHVAREIVAALEDFDATELQACYSASGSPATDPVLMLRMVLIELRRGRFRPAQWYQDTQENEALKWAGFGICPGRTAWYTFHDRIGPFLELWNRRVVEQSLAEKVSAGSRAARDGSTVEANASRHRLVNPATLTRRQADLEAACALDERGELVTAMPAWMARTPLTRGQQKHRYEQAPERWEQLQAVNQRQDPCRRRAPQQIVVRVSDPQAALGRDKFPVFRPLYNTQLVRDVGSPLILAYEVFAQPNDGGTLKPRLAKLAGIEGLEWKDLLVDAGYVTASNLALAEQGGITLYGPWQENDYSHARPPKPGAKPKLLAKDQFTWNAEGQVYICPEGHPLSWIGQDQRVQADGEVNVMHSYRCEPCHCCACPRSGRCTTNPKRGRSVKRSEHETLVEAHRARMVADEAKAIYKLRKQTVELGFADVKQHRALRRFPRRGLNHARTHLALTVLVHNLLVRHQAFADQTIALNTAAYRRKKLYDLFMAGKAVAHHFSLSPVHRALIRGFSGCPPSGEG